MISVLDQLRQQVAASGADPDSPEGARPIWTRTSVEDSPDLRRIENLPRRVWSEAETEEMVELLTRAYARVPGVRLRPIQAQALAEAHDYGGLLGPIGVGHGKCVAGDTEFLDASSGRRRTADELGAFYVPSLHEKTRIAPSPAVCVRSGSKECLRVTMADGTSVTVSHDHPIWGAHGWVRAGELAIGDFVGLAAQQPAPLHPLRLDHAPLVVLAGMLANGGCSQANKTFSQLPGPLLDEFLRSVERLGGHCTPKKQKSKCLEFNVCGLQGFMQAWGLEGLSKHKRVPAKLWGLDTDGVALFLNRFLAMDGHVSAANIECVLASEKLIDDLRFLLLRLGIRSRKHYKAAKCQTGTFDAWRIFVSGADALILLQRVGYLFGKEEACERLETKLRSILRNTNFDVVPFSGKSGWAVERLRKETGRGWSVALGGRSDQCVGREKFQRVCRERDYTGSLSHFASDDVVWERVVRLEPVGVLPVYDLSVPETENFIANGVIVHNTLLSLLAPVVLEAKQPLIIVPAKLKHKTYLEAKEYEKSWKVASYFHVESYEMLGRVSGADLLERLRPDLLIMDEAHRAKNPRAAVTRRLKRYLEANPETRVIALSGTITKRSLKDFAHLAKWALPRTNPTPEDWAQTEIWAQAIDEKTRDVQRVHPGEMIRLCNDEERREFSLSPINGARHAFRRRLVETPGVIATSESQLGVSLVLEMVEPHIGPAVEEAFSRLRHEWETPDGQPIADGIALWRHARELACGFYYRWVVRPPEDWLAARRAWAKFVRDTIKHNRSGIDSELQVAQACALWLHHTQNPDANTRHPPRVPDAVKAGTKIYEDWLQVKPTFNPVTEAVWIDDHMINHCLEWLKHHKGIVWTDMIAFGDRLSQVSGLPYFGAQARDARSKKFLHEHPRGEAMIASVNSVGEGQNLQAWNRNLIVSAPQTGATWEQLLGRTHRPGQEEDEVYATILVACTEQYKGVMQAVSDAKYMQTVLGQPQKLCYADKDFFDLADLQKKALSPRWAKSGLEQDS